MNVIAEPITQPRQVEPIVDYHPNDGDDVVLRLISYGPVVVLRMTTEEAATLGSALLNGDGGPS